MAENEEKNLSFEEAMSLFDKGLVGTIEFRNWLARMYPDFATVRDSDVDDDIRSMAKMRQDRMKAEALIGTVPG